MSWRITSPSIERRCDNVTYMLCIFSGMLLGGWCKSMIKWSNVCPCVLKFVKQKVGAIGNWYLLIVNVLEVFDFGIWWWYWKLLDMGYIGMTFLGRFSNIMSYKRTCFLMILFKLIKILIGGCIIIYILIHLTSMKEVFSIYQCFHWQFLI